MNAEYISLSEVAVSPAHRELRDYSELAESIQRVGLLNPVTVTDEYVLVSGLHRLEACRSLNWEQIPAHVLDVDNVGAEIAQIDENLMRQELTVLERGEHYARRNELLEALGERAKVGDNQHGPETVSGPPPKTTEQIGEDSGVSGRTVRNHTRAAKHICDDAREIIRQIDPHDCDLPNSTRQLVELAKEQDHARQVEMASMVADGSAGSVWDAKKKLYGALEVAPKQPSGSSPSSAPSALDKLPDFELNETQKAYYAVSRYLVGLSRLDPDEVARQCRSDELAKNEIGNCDTAIEWFSRYRESLEQVKQGLEPGALRRVK